MSSLIHSKGKFGCGTVSESDSLDWGKVNCEDCFQSRKRHEISFLESECFRLLNGQLINDLGEDKEKDFIVKKDECTKFFLRYHSTLCSISAKTSRLENIKDRVAYVRLLPKSFESDLILRVFSSSKLGIFYQKKEDK